MAVEGGHPECRFARGSGIARRSGARDLGDVRRDLDDARREPLEPLPRRRDARGPRVVGGLQVPSQSHERRRCGSADGIRESAQRVGQAFEPAQLDDPVVGKRRESGPQRHQVTGEIAAVHRRDIQRRQRLARLRVVPVVEMTLVSLEGRHRAHGVRRAQQELAGRDVAEIVGGEIRKQREPHVRRRRAVRDHRDRMLLLVVRRQPLVVGTDERLEERPGPARERSQKDDLLGSEARFARARAAGSPSTRCRGNEPQQRGSARRSPARPNPMRPAGWRRPRRSPGRSTSPGPMPQVRGEGVCPVCPLARRRSGSSLTDGFHSSSRRWRDEHPPRGPRDRIEIDRRLVGQEGKRQRCLRGVAARDAGGGGEVLLRQHFVRLRDRAAR